MNAEQRLERLERAITPPDPRRHLRLARMAELMGVPLAQLLAAEEANRIDIDPALLRLRAEARRLDDDGRLTWPNLIPQVRRWARATRWTNDPDRAFQACEDAWRVILQLRDEGHYSTEGAPQ